MKTSILILFIVFSFIAMALYLRGRLAFQGITWGLPNPTCSVSSNCVIDKNNISVNFGAYDPSEAWNQLDKIAIDHYFIQWNTFSPGEIKKDIAKTSIRNRWPLFTFEPYPIEEIAKDTVLEDISNGLYDQIIISMCAELSETGKPSFIRFGHEMERVTGRYPWAVSESGNYISAYTHFVKLCKENYSQGFYVWSPAGENNLAEYWPDGSLVDYVGLSVYSLSTFDKDYYGHERSFKENFGEKYERVKKYERPVMIAELGVSGTSNQQRDWIIQMTKDTAAFPLLKTIVYFNSKDNQGAWDERYGIPDWRLDKSVFTF